MADDEARGAEGAAGDARDEPAAPAEEDLPTTRTFPWTERWVVPALKLGDVKAWPAERLEHDFDVGGLKFSLWLYPQGIQNEQDLVSLYLYLKTHCRSIDVIFCFTLLKREGATESLICRRQLDKRTLTPQHSSWGLHPMATHEKLSKDNGELVVECQMIIDNMLDDDYAALPRSMRNVDDILVGYRELLESEDGADVTFTFNGEKVVAAHRNILSVRSPVLRAMLTGPFREGGEATVDIGDTDPAAFLSVVRFLYCGDLQPHTFHSSAERAQHLLVAADKYDVTSLKEETAVRLAECVSAESVADSLTLAHQHDCKYLKEVCSDYVIHNASEVVGTDGWKNLLRAAPEITSELLVALSAELASARRESARTGV